MEENATRRHLLAEALLQLPEERRAQVLEAAEAAGVPDGHHHDLGEVNATIDALDASERAKDDMRAVYRILAEAEATAHGCAVEETHFHEVGNGEALRNVLAICLAVEALDPDEIAATRVQTGSGTVRCAHWHTPGASAATLVENGVLTVLRTLAAGNDAAAAACDRLEAISPSLGREAAGPCPRADQTACR